MPSRKAAPAQDLNRRRCTSPFPFLMTRKKENADVNTNNVDTNSVTSSTETVETDTDDSSVHTPSTTSHFQCYPRSNTRTSTASSSSSDSASSDSPASSESTPPVTPPTNVRPPPPTKDLPTLPVEAQLQEPSSLPLVSDHRRLSLPEHLHPHLPQAGNASQYATQQQLQLQHRLSAIALQEYKQLQDLRTRLGQLVLFAASQAHVSADETKSRFEVLAVRSRRRAWSNKALTPVARSVIVCSMHAAATTSAGGSAGGSTTLGLATPFRGSPPRYTWSPEDFARDAAAAAASTSMLTKKSAYGSLSVAFVKTCFPRFRPRLDYEATLAAAVVELPSGHTADDDDNIVEEDDEEDDSNDNNNNLVDQEFELYEEFRGPSPLGGGRARRHHRRRNVGMATTTRGRAGAAGGVGRLFPVSEEMEGEDSQEFVMSLSVQSRGRPRRTLVERTFMGCDEVRVEGCDEEDDDDDDEGFVGGGGGVGFLEDTDFDDAFQDARELDLELGFGGAFDGAYSSSSFGGSGGGSIPFVMVDDADIDGLSTNMDRLEMGFVERPKIRPRVRTSSMMGAFVQKAKGVQRSLQSGAGLSHRLKMTTPVLQPRQLPSSSPPAQQPNAERNHSKRNGLTKDSLLCQPILVAAAVPGVHVPQQGQHQLQLKTTKTVAAPPPSYGNASPVPPTSSIQARKAMDVSRTPTPTPVPIYTQVEIDMVTDDSMQISISSSGMDEFEPSAAAYGLKGASAAALPLPLPLPALAGLPKAKIPLDICPQVGGGDGQEQLEEFTLAMDLPCRGRDAVASCGGRRRGGGRGRGGGEVHYDHQTMRRSSFENGKGLLRPKLGGIFEEAKIPQIQV